MTASRIMRLDVLMFYQDDPKKCTAAKMSRFGLVRQIRKIPKRSLVLDPFAQQYLLHADRRFSSIVGIDCSWRLAGDVFGSFEGFMRRLPPLLAGNPVNYAKLNKLSTAEALAAGLYILGHDEQASGLLAKFKWGHTFYELNQNILSDYSCAKSDADVDAVIREYRLD